MSYSVAVTQAGQMTIPKILRDRLGIETKVRVEDVGDAIIVRKELTPREELETSLAEIDSLWTDAERKQIRGLAGKSYEQVVDELEETLAGRTEIEAEYGKGIYGD